ncbi:unnamed protein product [Didymodactylos carnosus]|uniref:Deacetylase sirtuin-type domain-containing protein n=1 Tax=Didymodactylos carnosus TaxID=1234261 RepID=A0A8S2IY14_9BILA|nr:unnamed protein product [Didymodactylos carnosus]CAF3783304.1 unnamed protein product [Didymodactylos carnosus]
MRVDNTLQDATNGNKCETTGCNGRLRCTTVAFTQSMPDICLDLAIKQSNMCDLSLCMGTSMRVAPACKLPTMGLKSGGTMVIVNLQKTPYDDHCALRIYARCDEVLAMVMKELNVEIPPYKDLKLASDSNWMKEFEKNWPFRRTTTKVPTPLTRMALRKMKGSKRPHTDTTKLNKENLKLYETRRQLEIKSKKWI